MKGQFVQKTAGLRRQKGNNAQASVKAVCKETLLGHQTIDYLIVSGQYALMLRWFMCLSWVVCAASAFSETQSSAEDSQSKVAFLTGDAGPPAREANLPRTRWEHVGNSKLWTRSVLAALKDHGKILPETVPDDIADWCPAYPQAGAEQRRAFWAGFISTLVKHESTYRPTAVGGGNLWFGLTQIYPPTARLYKCHARSGAALKHGPSNLSCAIRIMARTVPRDNVVSRGMRGVAADWGPLHSRAKRNDMKAWTRRQTYCRLMSDVRPKARPNTLRPIEAVAETTSSEP